MGDYRRVGSAEQHSGNEMSTTLMLQLTDLWRSPRGTVLRIEALALVAIVLSFFLAVFGSCRRWSNRWIVQKGFLAAQVLSLSLGTYSIGLMQSSSVKSEMYPIWAVSLLTLFGCVDPVTTYIGLDYKGPFLKMIFQLCLYCGYVVLMSVSIGSGVVGNSAIGVLTTITFIKGFHRSLAFVLPSRTREIYLGEPLSEETSALLTGDGGDAGLSDGGDAGLEVISSTSLLEGTHHMNITMVDIHKYMGELQWSEVTANGLTIEDICLGYSLSHLLQRRFLGLSSSKEMEEKIETFENLVRDADGRLDIDYKRTLKVIEVELAFLYEVYFSSNEFLHLYQAKTGSFWTLASFIAICFVGVAAAIRGSSHRVTTSGPAGAGTIVVVDTTTADLIITLFISLSLALLQLLQLVRCWTSNWARVAFACEYTGNQKKEQMSPQGQIMKKKHISRWMRLKAFLATRINWFDKYLWQDKLGQHSVGDARRGSQHLNDCCARLFGPCKRSLFRTRAAYAVIVLLELVGSDTNSDDPTRLHDDVKTSIVDFLGQIKSRRIGVDWSSLFVDNGLDASYLPYSNVPLKLYTDSKWSDNAFTQRVMIWHIATWYCEQRDPQELRQGGTAGEDREKNRRVAKDLSKYCVYLVMSAAELLPGNPNKTSNIINSVNTTVRRRREDALGGSTVRVQDLFWTGVYWGRRLLNETETLLPPLPSPGPGSTVPRPPCSDDHWKVLALLWIQTLVYAVPYGDAQRHMQHLSQGGEFITHLWALLYHLGIDKWEHDEPAATATAAAQETTSEEKEETVERGAGGHKTGISSSEITEEPEV